MACAASPAGPGPARPGQLSNRGSVYSPSGRGPLFWWRVWPSPPSSEAPEASYPRRLSARTPRQEALLAGNPVGAPALPVTRAGPCHPESTVGAPRLAHPTRCLLPTFCTMPGIEKALNLSWWKGD